MPAQRLDGHLHVEFYPPLRTADKLKYPAGSEQGAGTFISDVLPEESAEHLREALAVAVERVRAFAPGRVNLIGEHTDYNGGLALPFAIAEGITVSARSGPSAGDPGPPRIEAIASDLGERDEFSVGEDAPQGGWRAFVRGSRGRAPARGLEAPVDRPRDRRGPAAWRGAVILGGPRGRPLHCAARARPGAASRPPRPGRARAAVRARGERLGGSADRPARPAREPLRRAPTTRC